MPEVKIDKADLAAATKELESEKSSNTTEPPQEETPAAAKAEQTAQNKTVNKQAKTEKVADKKKEDISSIRVDTDKLNKLINLVGEIVITQSMLSMISTSEHAEHDDRLESTVEILERNTRELQEAVMSIRMMPISIVFSRFPRVVRQLSKQLGKNIALEIEGESTEIDKSLTEKLVDPLTHLIRNSIDHGIESPEGRADACKPETGTVKLSAEQRGSNIVVSITDDGAGLNRQKILDKAMENNLIHSTDMPDEEVWRLIFEPGFSTAAAVTDVSGRGVGMDVVRRNIESIGGDIEIRSNHGFGTQFDIVLPLTLAIVEGMTVSASEQIYVIPLANIIESILPTEENFKQLANQNLLWVREKYWPIINLAETMGESDTTPNDNQVLVLVESRKRQFALQVDALLGQQSVVIKSLENNYKKVPGISGATIMGDGKVALILDVEGIALQLKEQFDEKYLLETVTS